MKRSTQGLARLSLGNGLFARNTRALGVSMTSRASCSPVWSYRTYADHNHGHNEGEEKPYRSPDFDGVPEPRANLRVYTREDVARHNSPDDCWVIINNKIYDVTLWADLHPGGREILYQNAGKDATDVWAMAPHNTRALYLMDRHVVGKVDTPRRFQGLDQPKTDFDEEGWKWLEPDVSDDKHYLEDMSKWRESNIAE